MLDFSYKHFPEILDLDIDLIKKFDRLAAATATAVLNNADA
jgi:hypothetical protein